MKKKPFVPKPFEPQPLYIEEYDWSKMPNQPEPRPKKSHSTDRGYFEIDLNNGEIKN